MLTRAAPSTISEHREASSDDPGGISRNLTYCFLRLANLDNGVFRNGSDAMRLRYGDSSCRGCLRSKRSDTDKSLLSQVGFWGASIPQRLVCGFVAQAHSDAHANAGMALKPASAPWDSNRASHPDSGVSSSSSGPARRPSGDLFRPVEKSDQRTYQGWRRASRPKAREIFAISRQGPERQN